MKDIWLVLRCNEYSICKLFFSTNESEQKELICTMHPTPTRSERGMKAARGGTFAFRGRSGVGGVPCFPATCRR